MRLSVAALVFYLSVFILWSLQVIPSPTKILSLLDSLFASVGLLGVFIAVLIESIVFLGLYFPGSFILAVAVFLSNGTFIEFFVISFITSIALFIGSLINFYLGKHKIINVQVPNLKTGYLWFLLTFLHPNSMAFYFYSQGLKKQNFGHVALVPFFILPYGIIVAYLLFLMRNNIKVVLESPYLMITLIGIWICFSYVLTKYKSGNKSRS